MERIKIRKSKRNGNSELNALIKSYLKIKEFQKGLNQIKKIHKSVDIPIKKNQKIQIPNIDKNPFLKPSIPIKQQSVMY